LFLEACLERLTDSSAQVNVIPSFDFDPEPGLLALDLMEFTSNLVTSDASSIVLKV
jgi:hypothetical protein